MEQGGSTLVGGRAPRWLIVAIRTSAAVVLRRTPQQLRGRQRLLEALDSRLRGPHPLVLAPMRLGYTMRVDLRSRTEFAAYYTGRYDNEQIQVATALLPPGGTAIDVGANVGFWSVPLAQVGTVHAFEPVPGNAVRIEQNASMNNVTAMLHVHRLALSDAPGKAEISLREDFSRGAATGNASLVVAANEAHFPVAEVELTTLDAWATEFGLARLDVIKVDIEGYEDLFLAGARATVERFRPAMWIEWNREYYRRRDVDPTDRVGAALQGIGYQFLRQTSRGWKDQGRFFSPLEMDDLLLVTAEKADEAIRALSTATGCQPGV